MTHSERDFEDENLSLELKKAYDIRTAIATGIKDEELPFDTTDKAVFYHQIRLIWECFLSAYEIWKLLDDETQRKLEDTFVENFSIFHCIRWGLNSCEEVLRMIRKGEWNYGNEGANKHTEISGAGEGES